MNSPMDQSTENLSNEYISFTGEGAVRSLINHVPFYQLRPDIEALTYKTLESGAEFRVDRTGGPISKACPTVVELALGQEVENDGLPRISTTILVSEAAILGQAERLRVATRQAGIENLSMGRSNLDTAVKWVFSTAGAEVMYTLQQRHVGGQFNDSGYSEWIQSMTQITPELAEVDAVHDQQLKHYYETTVHQERILAGIGFTELDAYMRNYTSREKSEEVIMRLQDGYREDFYHGNLKPEVLGGAAAFSLEQIASYFSARANGLRSVE